MAILITLATPQDHCQGTRTLKAWTKGLGSQFLEPREHDGRHGSLVS